MRVLIAGAASGIGRATCLRLARDARTQGQSARVAAVDMPHPPHLKQVADEVRALGAEVLPPGG